MADLSPPSYTPLQKLRKAYELRTGNLFNDVIKKSGRHVHTIHRGLLLHILRWEYGYQVLDCAALCGYNGHQPVLRIIRLFESELTVNPTLRRDYEAILIMLL